jgi:hypothetical protein
MSQLKRTRGLSCRLARRNLAYLLNCFYSCEYIASICDFKFKQQHKNSSNPHVTLSLRGSTTGSRDTWTFKLNITFFPQCLDTTIIKFSLTFRSCARNTTYPMLSSHLAEPSLTFSSEHFLFFSVLNNKFLDKFEISLFLTIISDH